MILHHVTPAVNRLSILALGLRPHGPDWPIHLAVDDRFLEVVQLCHDTDDVVVLQVDVTGLPLAVGADGPESWSCHELIPPERIKVVEAER